MSYQLRTTDLNTGQSATSTLTSTFGIGYDSTLVPLDPLLTPDSYHTYEINLGILEDPVNDVVIYSHDDGTDTITVWPDLSPTLFQVTSVQNAVAAPGSVTITRANTSGTLSLSYTVDSSSTAVVGVDYVALSGVVTFADGQSTATISVTPILSGGTGGPGGDPESVTIDAPPVGEPGSGVNAIKSLVLNLVSPVVGFVFQDQPALAIFKQPPAVLNNPPVFGSPNGYAFMVPYAAKAGTLVGQVTATDADGDVLAYAITSGNTDGYFRLVRSANLVWIAVAKDLPGTSGPVQLGISVTDNRPFSLPVANTVAITPKPYISINGDLIAVKKRAAPGKADGITLRLSRPGSANDLGGILLPELQVKLVFTLPPGLQDELDTDLSGDVTVTFAAGQRFATFAIKPKFVDQVGNDERVKKFGVVVKSGQPGYFGTAQQTDLFLVPAVQLFAKANDDPNLADTNPSGIEINDIKQGMYGNCWLWSEVIGIVNKDRTIIQNMMVDNGDGTVTIKYFKLTDTGVGAEPTGRVTLDLLPTDMGGLRFPKPKKDGWTPYEEVAGLAGQARFLGDHEGAQYEVWTQLLEMAFVQQIRSDLEGPNVNVLIGAHPAMVAGKALMNTTSFDYSTDITKQPAPDQQISVEQRIRNAIANGRVAVLITDPWTEGKPLERRAADGALVPYGHAMTILGIVPANTGTSSDDWVSIANPWDPTTPFKVRFSEIITYFEFLSVSTPI